MALKNYYQLLELAPTASTDDIKRAFRLQIARYHPDKVQHLGKEFQAMAADRAAELTEAYRILSDGGRRAEYDQALSLASDAPAAAATPHAAPSAAPRSEPGAASTPPPPPPPTAEPRQTGPQFSQERATRDEFVRKATMGRLRAALDQIDSSYDECQVRGFDLAWIPKSKMFSRGKGPRLLARFVSRVDGEGIVDAWTQAQKWAGADEVCVMLIGPTLAPAAELAKAIAEQRRKSRGAKIALIPVDARNWDAHLPTDTPTVCKSLLTRLRTGG